MIVLDTNVVSALMRGPADTVARSWLDQQPQISVWTTSVTVFELRFGLERLPAGKRRDTLSRALQAIFEEDLEGRIVGLGRAEAAEAATFMASRRSEGRPSGFGDALIAGIAKVHRATLATRNIKHFADAGIGLVDPWAA